MPELPEVEVLRRSLERLLPGERLEGCQVHSPALREPIDGRQLEKLVSGRRVLALRRRAKYLLIDLEGGSTLVVHLGMSGRLTVVVAEEPRAPHEHLSFTLGSSRRLRLVDPRRFGVCFAVPTERLASDRHFEHLGVEPLGDAPGGGGLDGAHLAWRARGRRGPIKAFLMDQQIVVGVGNIYVCESLWRARVHPRRSVARVAGKSWERIASEIRAVLEDAIRQGGTTLNDFADGLGNEGYFQVSLGVYGREAEPCLRCGASIRRIVQSNRSSFYCPRCQR